MDYQPPPEWAAFDQPAEVRHVAECRWCERLEDLSDLLEEIARMIRAAGSTDWGRGIFPFIEYASDGIRLGDSADATVIPSSS